MPQWYDLTSRVGAEAGTAIRVHTDERPNASAAVLSEGAGEWQPLSLLSLANFSSIEHGILSAATADLDRALDAIVSEILRDRPRWDCIRLLELDPSEESYGTAARVLRRAGLLVECTESA